MATRNPLADLDVLQSRGVQPIVEALDRLVVAKLGRDLRVLQQALDGLGRVLRQTGSLSELLGRRRLLLEAKAKGARQESATAVREALPGAAPNAVPGFSARMFADEPRNAFVNKCWLVVSFWQSARLDGVAYCHPIVDKGRTGVHQCSG